MSDDSPTYRVLSTETVYQGRALGVRVDHVAMAEGSEAVREVAVVDDAVAIVALDGDRRVCLLRQYRHPFGEYLLELPAGKMDVDGEAPLATARRELQEEAALSSDRWRELTCFQNSVGWSTERTHVFLAEAVRAGAAPDFLATHEEADMEVAMVPLDEALRMVNVREISDAKTIIGLLLANETLGIDR
jgi:8-oxo-dGDP phosphatase